MPSISTRKRNPLYGSMRAPFAMMFASLLRLLVDERTAGLLDDLEDHELRRRRREDGDLDGEDAERDGRRRIERLVDAHEKRLGRRRPFECARRPNAREEVVDNTLDL